MEIHILSNRAMSIYQVGKYKGISYFDMGILIQLKLITSNKRLSLVHNDNIRFLLPVCISQVMLIRILNIPYR